MNDCNPLPHGFKKCGALIHTKSLDYGGHGVDLGLYTLGFKLKDNTAEPWTSRFVDFKAGHQPAVRAGAATLATALQSLNFAGWGRVVTLGAISSGDTTLSPNSPVHSLCETVSRAQRWEWVQDVLTKRMHRSLHNLRGGFGERDAEVMHAYSATKIAGNPGIVVIIDDFLTRGATAADIRRAINSSNPGWHFACLSLGKTETMGFWRERWNFSISNSHIPLSLSTVWDSTR
jgi:hypothetical protein